MVGRLGKARYRLIGTGPMGEKMWQRYTSYGLNDEHIQIGENCGVRKDEKDY